jgi:hypothetical protein
VSEHDTEIIPSDARYSLMIVMAYCTEKASETTWHPRCSLMMLGQSGWLHDNRVTWEDASRVLDEVVALGHAKRDANGCHTITPEGLVWLEVEALTRQGAQP